MRGPGTGNARILNRSITAASSSTTAGTEASASGRISQRLAGRHSLTSSRAVSSSRDTNSATSPTGDQIVRTEGPVPLLTGGRARGAEAGSRARYTAASRLDSMS